MDESTGHERASTEERRRHRQLTATTRLVATSEANSEPDWGGEPSTMSARMAAVWQLTLQCLAWSDRDEGEPRLQRSVVRVQRGRR